MNLYKMALYALVMFNSTILLCMQQDDTLVQHCFHERRCTKDKDGFRTIFVCLQDKNICMQPTSCCSLKKSCCRGELKCCRSSTKNCCGDVAQCGCTTDKKIAKVILQSAADTCEVSYSSMKSDMFVKWIMRKAKTNSKFANTYQKGWPLLCILAKQGNAQACKDLLKLGARTNVSIKNSLLAPLHVATTIDVIRILLQYGANTEQTESCGWTPLHSHIQRSNIATVRYLIKKKANINHITDFGLSALHQAGRLNASAEIITLLLDNGANYLLLCNGLLPIEHMSGKDRIKPFEKYGFVIFNHAIGFLLKEQDKKQKLTDIKKRALQAKKEGAGGEFLREYAELFEDLAKTCHKKDSDLTIQEKQDQSIKKTALGFVLRYPSYELLCQNFDKNFIDSYIELNTYLKKYLDPKIQEKSVS